MANKIQIRHDTTANWTAVDPTLSLGELGLDITLHKIKIGNGTSPWSGLDFFVGDTGPQGPVGDTGPQGPAGVTELSELTNGNKTISVGGDGTLYLESPTSAMFTVTFSPAHYVSTQSKPTLTLSSAPWELHGEYGYSSNGGCELMLDNMWPALLNPGYDSGDSFTFDESVHGIYGYTLTITLNDVVYSGDAGWTANVAVSQPPAYPSSVNSAGALKVTANTTSWVFGTDGSLTLPINGLIKNNDGTTYGGGNSATDRIVNGNSELILNIGGQDNPYVTFPIYNNVQLHIQGGELVVSGGDAVLLSDANVTIRTDIDGSGLSWDFDINGKITFPNIPTNSRTGNAETLSFAKSNSQKSIATASGNVDNPTVERLVIAGGDGYQDPDTGVFTPYSEGGDLYLWAGRGADGGDIKIDAGNSYGTNNELGGDIKIRSGYSNSGSGGFLEMRAGTGATNGGYVTLNAGDGYNSPSNGGYVNIAAGSGYANGGDINITAGGANQQGGTITLNAGYASNGQYGNITINNNNHQWLFNNTGNLVFPTNITVPTTSKGAVGDKAGTLAFDATNIYYCIGDYVSHTITLTVNNIRGPAQNAGYSNNGGGFGTMVGFDGSIAGLTTGQTFTHNAVQYTIQDVDNSANQYAYIIFTPQMDGPTTAGITAGTVFTISDGIPQPDIWVKRAWTTGTW